MILEPSSTQTCPDCGRSLSQDGGCLHCAMESALSAAVASPEVGLDLLSEDAGFASFADPALPMQVGRFRLLRRLGMGGMGTVYEAEDGVLGRTVALKMIRGFHFSTADELSRFQREAQAAARLDHPHIVPVYEIGEVEGCPFLSMKIIRGGTLADRLKDGRLTAEKSATIMAKVAAAVGHAHEKGILHRDLKPSNILIDEAGKPWLTDFGMARLSGSDVALTVTGAQIGTPHYMSPEQASGLVRGVTAASDVWGLGAMFYQMLSGHLPYDGESSVAIMHEVVSASPPKLEPKTSREMDLSVLIERCLQKEPAERMQSANLLAEELERWLVHKPIRSRPVSPLEKGWRWTRRHPVAVAGAAVALTVAGLLVKYWPSSPAAAAEVVGVEISRQGTELHVRCVGANADDIRLREYSDGQLEVLTNDQTLRMPDGTILRRISRPMPLVGVTRIVVDAGGGNDEVHLGGFHGEFPALRINGGQGNDVVSFGGRLVFAPGADLDLDLQDDATPPGNDGVQFCGGSSTILNGAGSVTVRCTARIWIGLGAQVRTEDGAITLEANQQEPATTGPMRGVEMQGAFVGSDGKGLVTVKGRGGARGQFQFGISLASGSMIQGGTEGVITVTGTGGSSLENDNSGVNLEDDRCLITSKGADIVLEGRGNGAPDTGSNNGIVLVAGTIQGNGKVTVDGKGGATKGGSNHGVLLRGPTAAIRSNGGDIQIIGQGGGSDNGHATDASNRGVLVQDSARVKANGPDNINMEGRGGLGGGNDQIGVVIDGGKVDAAEGSIKLTGTPGNDSSPSVKVLSPGRLRTEGKDPRVIIEGERQDIGEGVVQVK